MRTIMSARSPHESSFSFSRRYFNWSKKVEDNDEDDMDEILTVSSSSDDDTVKISAPMPAPSLVSGPKKKAMSKLRSAFAAFHVGGGRSTRSHMIGTLFGHRRGHVRFAFQADARSSPVFLIELSTPTSVLVREMASGMVRVALETDRTAERSRACGGRRGLLDVDLWRTYCNGRKCGYALRRECGAEEWRVLKAVGPISMGAGVLPAADGGGEGDETGGSEGELMYMRARFERVMGSRDSEAFYMVNPDGNGGPGPELSVYLLRV